MEGSCACSPKAFSRARASRAPSSARSPKVSSRARASRAPSSARSPKARPPTHSCLLHCCRLAAPLLTLSPPSMRCDLGGTAILQRCRGRSFPRLPSPGFRLGCWPVGSTMASSLLLSTVARQSTSSAGLPRPSGSALVWRRPPCTSGLHSSSFASSLRPSGFVRLLHPLGSSSLLCRSGSTAASRIHALRRSPAQSAPPSTSGSSPSPLLSVSASDSSSTCSATVGQPPGVGGHSSSMAPPSVGSTVGHRYGCGLGPARLLLLLSLPWLLPPSSPPWTLLAGHLPEVRPPPEPPP